MDLTQRSWIDSANDPSSDFPLQNLPYGAFKHAGEPHLCIAIGNQVLDLHACAQSDLFASLPQPLVGACSSDRLNPLLALGPAAWRDLRHQLTSLLSADTTNAALRRRISEHLIPQRDADMVLPVAIGDYTDFYASIHHAMRVGSLFRPENPLLPNYKHIPIGYHGRSSSIVVSGHAVRRPCGQFKDASSGPVFGPTRSLDFELELGAFIGPGNPMGQPIPIAEADQHIFGLCLVNDWSARDIQAWEYQPLGPFLGKSFATSISPWIVPMDALAPYRVPVPDRPAGDPAPLPYLQSPSTATDSIDLRLEVYLQSQRMHQMHLAPLLVTTSNASGLYWSLRQMTTHHTSNGCNLRPGDLIATGTISGPLPGSEGCLLEKSANHQPIQLPSGETRTYLEDGDTVFFRAFAVREGCPRIGFGECRGTIHPAS